MPDAKTPSPPPSRLLTPKVWTIIVGLNGLGLAWYEAIAAKQVSLPLIALAGGMIGLIPADLIDAWVGRRS